MNNIAYSFILTTLAGLSTLFGFLAVYVKGNPNKIISFFLGLASGVMIVISIIDLIPLSFWHFQEFFIIYRLLVTLFFIILGIILSTLINKLLEKYETDNLKVIGFISVISMILHNIPEGMMTFITSQSNMNLGLSLSIAIGLHNIPEGIGIAIPLYYGMMKKSKVFIIVLLVGMSEMLGGIITYLFFGSIISNLWMGIIYALIGGIMLNMSLLSLFHKGMNIEPRMTLFGSILGASIIIISHYLL